MGVVVNTIADENLPDVTQALIMFTDDVTDSSFNAIMQQTAKNNQDPLRVTDTNGGRKKSYSRNAQRHERSGMKHNQNETSCYLDWNWGTEDTSVSYEEKSVRLD